MANIDTIKNNANLVKNETEIGENTAARVGGVLVDIADYIGDGYMFAGIATPSTNPGAPDGNVFYFATQAGTYTNFGSVVLNEGLNILLWNGTSWAVTNAMNIVQELGDSETAVMSQKAVTDILLDKNTSTYLKNILKLDETWQNHQGNSSYENGVCTFQSTGTSANIYMIVEVPQGYNSIYLGGIIDTQGNTTTQYIQCLIYRKGIASPSTRELSVIKNNANEFTYGGKFTFDEEIEKITFRYRIGESNKTVLFKNPIAVLLSNINDLELGDYFEGTKDFYSDYSKEAGHSQCRFRKTLCTNKSISREKVAISWR